jgi:Rieske Fe-S protein
MAPNDATTDSDATPPYEEIEVERRQVAKIIAGISGAAAVGGFTIGSAAGLFEAGKIEERGPVYVQGTRLVDESGNTLNAADALPADEMQTLTAYPEADGGGAMISSRATTLLVRFSEDQYSEPTNVDATAEGYAAYSQVCTHEGCSVSETEGRKLVCPCHDSVYDPLAGATVTSGPAPRALPQLPLGVAEDGQLLIATGKFEGPIGPQ